MDYPQMIWLGFIITADGGGATEAGRGPQKEVAALLGVQQAVISKRERGKAPLARKSP